MLPIRIKACSESDLRMLGNLARNIQRVLPVTQADIDAAAALGEGWVVWKVIEVTDPIDNLRGGTQLVIKQNSITPGQNVRRVLIVSGPGGETVVIGPGPSPLTLPDAIADSLQYVKAFGGTEQRNLPDGYTQLEYLQSDGTQELRLPFLRRSGHTYKAEFDWEPVSYANSAGIFSFGADYLGYQISTYTSGGNGIGFSSSNYILTSGRTQMTATMSSDGLNLTLTNGTTTITHTRTSANYGYNPSIFGAWTNTRGYVKIYRFKFYEDDVLLFDLIPVTYNGTNSMYNKVDGSFLSVYAGTLIAGPTAVPTPNAPIDIVSNNGVLKARHQSGLPLRYQQVGWISSNAKIIITGFKTKDTQTFKAKFIKTSANSQYVYVSDSSSSGTTNTTAYIAASDASGGNWRFGGDTIPITTSTNVMYETTQNKNGIWINGSRVGTYSNIDSFTSTTDLGALSGSSAAPLRLYYLQVEENGIKVLDLVPVKDLVDNTYGLYDLVDGQFYTNTDATITAGSTVSDPVEIYTDGTVETIEDTIGNTATAEMLLKVGDYQDVQSIIDGVVTRNVGVKVLDGTENFETATATNCYSLTNTLGTGNFADRTIVCSHFASTPTMPGTGDRQGLVFIVNKGPEYTIAFGATTQFSTQALWQQFLADQYAAGTPVIVIYPLATATTESVAGQTLQVTDGDNVLEITQASLNNLELEAEYTKTA